MGFGLRSGHQPNRGARRHMDSNTRIATQFREAYAREVRRGVLLSIVGLWILLALFIPNAAAQFFATPQTAEARSFLAGGLLL